MSIPQYETVRLLEELVPRYSATNLRSGVLFFGGAQKCGSARVGGRKGPPYDRRALTLPRKKKERLIAGYSAKYPYNLYMGIPLPDPSFPICSLYMLRVKFEPESSSSHESSSSQVRFLLFSFSFCFVFVFIKGYDCDSCFHIDVPTDVRSIKHERDIIVNTIARIHYCSVAN